MYPLRRINWGAWLLGLLFWGLAFAWAWDSLRRMQP